MAVTVRIGRMRIQLSRCGGMAPAAQRERGEGTQSLSGVRAHAVGGGAAPVPELSPAGRQMPRLRWQKIPARDFWIEVLGGLCSCACAYAFGGETAQAALAFAVLGILTVVALMDMDTLEIYDRFPVLLFVCGIAAHILIPSLG